MAISDTTATQASTPTEERAQRALENVESWSRRAAELARTTADRMPAAVVVVVGGGTLLALDAFGVGEVLTAGIVAYATYRLLRRSVRKRASAAHHAQREEATV